MRNYFLILICFSFDHATFDDLNNLGLQNKSKETIKKDNNKKTRKITIKEENNIIYEFNSNEIEEDDMPKIYIPDQKPTNKKSVNLSKINLKENQLIKNSQNFKQLKDVVIEILNNNGIYNTLIYLLKEIKKTNQTEILQNYRNDFINVMEYFKEQIEIKMKQKYYLQIKVEKLLNIKENAFKFIIKQKKYFNKLLVEMEELKESYNKEEEDFEKLKDLINNIKQIDEKLKKIYELIKVEQSLIELRKKVSNMKEIAKLGYLKIIYAIKLCANVEKIFKKEEIEFIKSYCKNNVELNVNEFIEVAKLDLKHLMMLDDSSNDE